MSKYLELTLSTGDIVREDFTSDVSPLSPAAMEQAAKDVVGLAVNDSDGSVIGVVVSAKLVDDALVEQLDPQMQAVASESWFERAVLHIDCAVDDLKSHGLTKGTLYVGTARLCLDDPLAGALAEVHHAPADGLTILRLGVPDPGALLDASGGIAELSRKVREANPNGWLLLLPADWSFRTMTPEMAREFAVNMVSFVEDAELEKIGLKRIGA